MPFEPGKIVAVITKSSARSGKEQCIQIMTEDLNIVLFADEIFVRDERTLPESHTPPEALEDTDAQ